MPTYQVTCSACGEKRWPTLPDRPDRYVCALCTSKPVHPQSPERREARQRAARARWARQRCSQDRTEPPAGGGDGAEAGG
jgi:hypothetical protein